MTKEQYQIHGAGRVKMAGGSVNSYYECAEPIIQHGVTGAAETATNFRNLRERPPLPLLLAFFPDEPQNIKRRLRGAGLYRHLRMDQGPGGNFTAFQSTGQEKPLSYSLTTESGYAMLEHPVAQQLATGQFASITPLVGEIEQAFQQNDYRRTAQLVEQFQLLAVQAGVTLPNGEQVGSKTGFFFIRPTLTDSPVEFPSTLIPAVKDKVMAVMQAPLAMADYAKQQLAKGVSYEDAVSQGRQLYYSNGGAEKNDSPDGLIYFQPDCFIDNQGNVHVEKVNTPDVGLFLTQLDTQGNLPLAAVVEVNRQLRCEVENTIQQHFPGRAVTIVTRDEVLQNGADTLEQLEIQALSESLTKMGKQVSVKAISQTDLLTDKDQVLLLNVPAHTPSFKQFATRVARQNIVCYPNPMLREYEDMMTSLRKVEIGGDKLAKLLAVIKPKELNQGNAERLHAEILKYLDAAQITEDILYVTFPGSRQTIPVFRYSLHSFFQIYNAFEKEQQQGRRPQTITFSPVPFTPESAIFTGKDGPRLSAFRFMFTK